MAFILHRQILGLKGNRRFPRKDVSPSDFFGAFPVVKDDSPPSWGFPVWTIPRHHGAFPVREFPVVVGAFPVGMLVETPINTVTWKGISLNVDIRDRRKKYTFLNAK